MARRWRFLIGDAGIVSDRPRFLAEACLASGGAVDLRLDFRRGGVFGSRGDALDGASETSDPLNKTCTGSTDGDEALIAGKGVGSTFIPSADAVGSFASEDAAMSTGLLARVCPPGTPMMTARGLACGEG